MNKGLHFSFFGTSQLVFNDSIFFSRYLVMEFYHYFIILIKAIVGIQFVLIFLKKESHDNEIFIITDTIFTISIALFIMSYFTLLNTNAVINYHEKY